MKQIEQKIKELEKRVDKYEEIGTTIQTRLRSSTHRTKVLSMTTTAAFNKDYQNQISQGHQMEMRSKKSIEKRPEHRTFTPKESMERKRLKSSRRKIKSQSATKYRGGPSYEVFIKRYPELERVLLSFSSNASSKRRNRQSSDEKMLFPTRTMNSKNLISVIKSINEENEKSASDPEQEEDSPFMGLMGNYF